MTAVPETIQCPKCGAPVMPEDWNRTDPTECSGCESRLHAAVFPAFHRKHSAPVSQPAVEGESSCFFHPAKQAVVPCDECGRFLCALCQVEFGSRNVCPGCIGVGLTKKNMPALEVSRTRYDSLTLAVATLPAIALWPTLFTAPIAIYLAIRYWKEPPGVLPRSGWRMALALAIAVFQVVAWAALILFAIANRKQLRI